MLSFKEFLVQQEQIQEQKGGQGVHPAGYKFVKGLARKYREYKELRAHGGSWLPPKKDKESSTTKPENKHSGGAYPHRPDTGYHKKKPSAYAVLRHNDEKEHAANIKTRGEKKTTKQKKHNNYLKTRMRDYADDDRKFKDKLNNGKVSRRDADGMKLKTS
jgi:hypothetical protein